MTVGRDHNIHNADNAARADADNIVHTTVHTDAIGDNSEGISGQYVVTPTPALSTAASQARHDRITAIWLGFVLFIVMAIVASIPATLFAVLSHLIIMGSTGINLDQTVSTDPSSLLASSASMGSMSPLLLELAVMWTLVFTPLCSLVILTIPVIRRAITANGGLGLDMGRVSSLLSRSGNTVMAWLKAIGIGLATAVIIFVLLQVAGGIALLISPGDTAQSNETTTQIIDGIKNGDMIIRIVFIVLAGVVIPLVEEIVFRGVIARSWAGLASSRWGRVLSYVGSGLLFALAHLLSTSLELSVSTVLTVLLTWVMGIVLSYYVDRMKTLWPGVFTHVAYNSGSLAYALLV